VVVDGIVVVDGVVVVLGSLSAEPFPVVICARPTPAAAANASPTNARTIVRRGKRCRPGTGLPSVEDLASRMQSPPEAETCGVPQIRRVMRSAGGEP
jgi:hypothetical protein